MTDKMYKIVVLVPRRDDVDLDEFVEPIWDAAFAVQDSKYKDREDWDIHGYATPEEDDHKWLYKNQENLLNALKELVAASWDAGIHHKKIGLAIRNAEETIRDLL